MQGGGDRGRDGWGDGFPSTDGVTFIADARGAPPGFWGGAVSFAGSAPGFSARVRRGLVGGQAVQAFEVVGHADQVPFATDFLESSQ